MSEELGLIVQVGIKVIELRGIIKKSEHYTNKELVKSIVDNVVEENKSQKEAGKMKLKLEKLKPAQLEKELELAHICNEPFQKF